MSSFLSELITSEVDGTAQEGRGIHRIHEPFVYQSDILGKTITVEAGFLTDFASVPRLPLVYFLFGGVARKSAVIHDWLFHHHEVCDMDTANLVLREAAQAEGIAHWRKMGIYLGVKFGGKSSWEEDAGNGHTIVNGKIV